MSPIQRRGRERVTLHDVGLHRYRSPPQLLEHAPRPRVMGLVRDPHDEHGRGVSTLPCFERLILVHGLNMGCGRDMPAPDRCTPNPFSRTPHPPLPTPHPVLVPERHAYLHPIPRPHPLF